MSQPFVKYRWSNGATLHFTLSEILAQGPAVELIRLFNLLHGKPESTLVLHPEVELPMSIKTRAYGEAA